MRRKVLHCCEQGRIIQGNWRITSTNVNYPKNSPATITTEIHHEIRSFFRDLMQALGLTRNGL